MVSIQSAAHGPECRAEGNLLVSLCLCLISCHLPPHKHIVRLCSLCTAVIFPCPEDLVRMPSSVVCWSFSSIVNSRPQLPPQLPSASQDQESTFIFRLIKTALTEHMLYHRSAPKIALLCTNNDFCRLCHPKDALL